MNQPDFYIIPSTVVIDKSLRPTDRILYGVIYWITRLRNEHCYASNSTLAELCQVSQRQIQAGLLRLEKGRYIERRFSSSRRNGRTLRDETIPLVVFNNPRTNVREGVRTNVHQNNRSPKNKNKQLNKKDVDNSVRGTSSIQDVLASKAKLYAALQK